MISTLKTHNNRATALYLGLLVALITLFAGSFQSVGALEAKDFKGAQYKLTAIDTITATIAGKQYTFKDTNTLDNTYNFKPKSDTICSGSSPTHGITLTPGANGNISKASIDNVGERKIVGIDNICSTLIDTPTTITVSRSLDVKLSKGAAKNCDASNYRDCLRNNPIIKDMQLIINFLSAGVAIVVVAMLMFAGIQYITAGSNPSLVESAKRRITNALYALLAWLFSVAFLNWLIPGGIL